MTKEQFLSGVSNWDNHRILLWEALQEINGVTVEFGCGDGSTPFLSKHCNKLFSYESNLEWLNKYKKYERDNHKLFFVKHWDDVEIDSIDVLLLDHAPGEQRKFDLIKYGNIAKIIVAHDTEPAADHGYQMRPVLKTFKYHIDYKTDGAWASAVSNFIDVTKWSV